MLGPGLVAFLLLLGVATSPAHAHHWQPSNPVPPRQQIYTNTTLNSAVQDWVKGYGPQFSAEWNGRFGNAGPPQTRLERIAAADDKTMRKGLVGRLLPKASRVLPILGAGYLGYEVCNVFISSGCWLFEAHDTPGTSDPDPIQLWDDNPHSNASGSPNGLTRNAGGAWVFASQTFDSQVYPNSWLCKPSEGPHCDPMRQLSGHEFFQQGSAIVGSDPPWPGDLHCAATPGLDPFQTDEIGWIFGATVQTASQLCTHPNGNPPPATITDSHVGSRLYKFKPLLDDVRPTGEPDNPAIPNAPCNPSCPQVPPRGQWATDFQVFMDDLPAEQRDRMEGWICHNVYPDQCADPYLASELQAVPNCVGLSYNQCVEALQDAGFGVYVRNTRSFGDAVPIPQAAADQVLGQSPLPATEVNVTTTTVTLDANPADADMPREVPEPLAREKGAAYCARIEAEPFALGCSVSTVTETQANPENGPDEVAHPITRLAPDAGTRVPRNTNITAPVNPPTWPVPVDGGGCDPWVTPGIDLSPLESIQQASNVFPFGVPGWVYAAMQAWVGTPEIPAWDFHFPFAGGGDNWHVDLAIFDQHMPAIRAVLLAASLIALAWFFFGLAVGAPANRQQGAD